MWNRLPGAVCSWKVVRFVSLAAMATTSMPDFEFETTNLDRSLRSSSFSTLPLTWKVSFAISTQRLFPIQTIQYHLFNATIKNTAFFFATLCVRSESNIYFIIMESAFCDDETNFMNLLSLIWLKRRKWQICQLSDLSDNIYNRQYFLSKNTGERRSYFLVFEKIKIKYINSYKFFSTYFEFFWRKTIEIKLRNSISMFKMIKSPFFLIEGE